MRPFKLLALSVVSGTLILSQAATAALAQDVASGAHVYQQKCYYCHSITSDKKSRVGPPLYGIVGRHAAHTQHFDYTQALKDAHAREKGGLVWDEAHLNAFLADPQKLAPGSAMTADNAVTDDNDRADLIAFLKTLKSDD